MSDARPQRYPILTGAREFFRIRMIREIFQGRPFSLPENLREKRICMQLRYNKEKWIKVHRDSLAKASRSNGGSS